MEYGFLRNIIKQVARRQDTDINADEKIEEKEEEQQREKQSLRAKIKTKILNSYVEKLWRKKGHTSKFHQKEEIKNNQRGKKDMRD